MPSNTIQVTVSELIRDIELKYPLRDGEYTILSGGSTYSLTYSRLISNPHLPYILLKSIQQEDGILDLHIGLDADFNLKELTSRGTDKVFWRKGSTKNSFEDDILTVIDDITNIIRSSETLENFREDTLVLF